MEISIRRIIQEIDFDLDMKLLWELIFFVSDRSNL